MPKLLLTNQMLIHGTLHFKGRTLNTFNRMIGATMDLALSREYCEEFVAEKMLPTFDPNTAGDLKYFLPAHFMPFDGHNGDNTLIRIP